MTGNERKIKRRVQLIVASAMAVFFCLLLTLVIQLAVIGNQNKTKNSLRAAQKELRQELDNKDKEKIWMTSDRFIDEFALRELGYGRKGSSIFN